METRVPLADARGDGYGWSSHHHVTRDDPEAWATAEVFAFGQLLRCVSGHVVAEAAAGDVKARRPEYASRAAAEKELGSRGSTWAPDRWTVGRQLAAMFLHPVRMPRAEDDKDVRDPDAPVIGLDNARSAVLYGPPGTGKTTIVEALAGALGWQFVEVLASDFLSAGIDAVPARADAIFDRLMQLDRCVFLFDEIDELIRDRRDEASDPFGRFLTTSMLPKIAKLWKQRRVIFFVATNHVSKADPAITRSSRFDASIFVAPPGLSVKRRLLADSLKAKAPRFDDSDVTQALEAGSAGDLPDHHRALAVLPLLRYDQMSELAIRLHRTHGVVSPGAFAKALVDVGKELLDHEWQPARKIEDWDAKDTVARLLAVYQEYVDERRHDFSRDWVLTVSSAAKECAPSSWQKLAHAKGETFFRCPNALTLHPETTHGELTLEGPAGTATDRRILAFDAPPA
jgi:DNA polymerase III delta prime subunit